MKYLAIIAALVGCAETPPTTPSIPIEGALAYLPKPEPQPEPSEAPEAFYEEGDEDPYSGCMVWTNRTTIISFCNELWYIKDRNSDKEYEVTTEDLELILKLERMK